MLIYFKLRCGLWTLDSGQCPPDGATEDTVAPKFALALASLGIRYRKPENRSSQVRFVLLTSYSSLICHSKLATITTIDAHLTSTLPVTNQSLLTYNNIAIFVERRQ
ncbi:unnamed protein product [Macrosiphum euphorbiae]|uniref:Uncharacterized protein n=1 Tax=Macrosiphum euphorbiae TaxID=13131 RepID=A0AAV0WWZ4_9HEMI|nr:unnamed protein product [Macrosiphum euphorbiae]